MKKQIRSTNSIEVNPKDHYNFKVLCLENEDCTQAEMFHTLLEEYRHNGK